MCARSSSGTWCHLEHHPSARHRDGTSHRVDTIDDLLALVVAQGGVAAGDARAVTESVLRALRTLVPEETSDVAAVLPAELRELWTGVGLD